MINKQVIKEIIDTWLVDISKKELVSRSNSELLRRYLDYKHVVAISGVRRVGKTYLMFQLIQVLLQKCPENVLYINFEDERFTGEVEQLDLIYKTFLEMRSPHGKLYFFLDEVQNIIGWEKWVARMQQLILISATKIPAARS